MSCRLEHTDARFVYAGRSYEGVPLLVDSRNRFVAPICDYLRFLVTHEHLKITSVETYADHLLNFYQFVEDFVEIKQRTFFDLTDKDLIAWMNRQKDKGVKTLTRAARCDQAFALYVWLEVNGYVKQVVRVPGFNDSDIFTPQLTARRSGWSRRASKWAIVSAVRPRRAKAELQHTPNDDEINKIYIAADGPSNLGLTERNHLLKDWYLQTGVRRKEWRALTMDQIPNWQNIDLYRERGEAHEVRLVDTKGGRARYVGVLPELMEKTREYIEGPRAQLVQRFKRMKPRAYREPGEVFLSEKTGDALALRPISNLLTSWFKKAGVSGHGHRLRAVYLTRLCEAELEAEEGRIASHGGTITVIDIELVLRKVADRAGIVDIETLRHYLTLVRKKRVRSVTDGDLVTLKLRVAACKHELAVLDHRIDERNAELVATG